MPAKFGYWKVKGVKTCHVNLVPAAENVSPEILAVVMLGQMVRFLLAFTGDDVEDKQYGFDAEKIRAGAGVEAAAEWFLEDKPSLPVPFPNVPYYIDDKVKLSQSLAIMKYLGRKYDLYGSTIEEAATIDVVAEEIRDYRQKFFELCHDSQFAEKKDEFKQKLLERLPSLEAFLADKHYVNGAKITWVDFMVYEELDKHRACWSDVFDGFPKIAAFLKRVEALPAIKAYMESDKFIKRPMMGPYATFNT